MPPLDFSTAAFWGIFAGAPFLDSGPFDGALDGGPEPVAFFGEKWDCVTFDTPILPFVGGLITAPPMVSGFLMPTPFTGALACGSVVGFLMPVVEGGANVFAGDGALTIAPAAPAGTFVSGAFP